MFYGSYGACLYEAGHWEMERCKWHGEVERGRFVFCSDIFESIALASRVGLIIVGYSSFKWNRLFEILSCASIRVFFKHFGVN